MKDLVEKIHRGAYWRVVIRPSEFERKRIRTRGICQQIVEASRVRLREWDYPFLERVDLGDDWIESGCDWEGMHYEYWRFYQSGQFVHHFTMAEEFLPLRWRPAPENYLLGLNTLYTATEIFLFASRVASEGVLTPGGCVSIELHGTQGKQLGFRNHPHDFIRLPHRIASQDVLRQDVSAPRGRFVASAAELAVSASTDIFESFGWLNPPTDILAEEQRKFTERRLGA